MSEAQEKPRRRQARGERRMAQLLEAAASVFCTSGYTAASTNAIARAAGVSPGTLYQFFPNKEAIATELGSMLVERMQQAQALVFTPQTAALPLRELIDQVVDPFLEFNCHHPAFLVLMKGPDTPGAVVAEQDALHAQLLDRIGHLLSLRAPHLPDDQCRRITQTALSVFMAGLELALAHNGAERRAYVAELKAVLHGYLAPYIGTEARTV